jgi:type I restriction enzyme R subunit
MIEGVKPSLLERKTTGNRIVVKIKEFVDTFVNGMMGS